MRIRFFCVSVYVRVPMCVCVCGGYVYSRLLLVGVYDEDENPHWYAGP